MVEIIKSGIKTTWEVYIQSLPKWTYPDTK